MTRTVRASGGLGSTAPDRGRDGLRRWRTAALVPVALGCLAACASAPAATRPAATPTRSSAPAQVRASAAARHAVVRRRPRPAPSPVAAPEAGWTPVSVTAGGVAVDRRSEPLADGVTVTVFRFRAGQVSFALHAGSGDPGPLGTTAGPSVTPAERPRLLAAFNGGFKLSAGDGGYLEQGHLVVPLRTGLASLVIYADGAAAVGVWGAGLPAPGQSVVSVRQNLPPLIAAGVASPAIADQAAWGATLGGGLDVARSGLGEDSAGNLLYAAAMAAAPRDLATALLAAGARNAMELDINPYWVQLDYAASPGAALATGVPGQQRPADTYLTGWTRDFVTVLAGPGRAG